MTEPPHYPLTPGTTGFEFELLPLLLAQSLTSLVIMVSIKTTYTYLSELLLADVVHPNLQQQAASRNASSHIMLQVHVPTTTLSTIRYDLDLDLSEARWGTWIDFISWQPRGHNTEYEE